MPTVPRIHREVGPQPLPNARRRAVLTPVAAGAALAQAQGNVGEALQQVGYTGGVLAGRFERARIEAAEQARADANRTAVMRLKNRADVWKRQNIYDPKTGYLTVKGENALLLPEKAQQDLKKFGEDIEPEINTPEQRLAWEEINAELQDSTMLTLYRHTSGEQHQLMVDENTARIENSQSLAIAEVQDPLQMTKHIREGMAAIEDQGRLLGWGKEKTDRAKFVFGSNVNVGAINALVVAKQNKKARTLFEAAKQQGAIEGEKLADLEKLVDEEDLTAQAQEAFDTLDKSGLSVGEQREAAKQQYTGKKRELVLDLIRQEQSDDQMAENAAIKARDHEITQILLNSKNPTFLSIPAHWRKDFGSSETTHWNAVIANIQASRESGGPPSPYAKVSDPDVLAGIITMASTNPKAFAALKLEAPGIRGYLTKEDYEQALRGRAAALAGEDKKLAEIYAGEFTFADVWKAQLAANDMKPNDPRTAEIMARVRLDGRILAFAPGRNGKPVTVPEWEQIIKQNLVQHTLSNPLFWSKDVRRGSDIRFEDIPAADVQEIVESINHHNPQNPVRNAATDGRVTSAYRTQLGKYGVGGKPSAPALPGQTPAAPAAPAAPKPQSAVKPVEAGTVTQANLARTMTYQDGGLQVLIPTVTPDGRPLSATAAIAQYKQTGNHLGKFKTVEAAEAYVKPAPPSRATTPRLQGPR
jgi:hypothetical protein